MIERGIGYWIAPSGEFVPTPPRISHADLIRQLIDPTALGEDQREAYLRDVNTFAIQQGWTRVRIYPSEKVCYADLGSGRGQVHLALIDELLNDLGLVGYQVRSTDERGNYVDR